MLFCVGEERLCSGYAEESGRWSYVAICDKTRDEGEKVSDMLTSLSGINQWTSFVGQPKDHLLKITIGAFNICTIYRHKYNNRTY